MAKLELNDISSILSNPTGAATAINNNNASIEEALENTLSRDGTSPNQMEANLDMNSKRILNLPSPMYDQEPVRLGDLPDLTGSPIVFGGMNPAVYDPTAVEGDVFDMDNMVQGAVNYFLNASLYNKLSAAEWEVQQFGTIGTSDDTAVFQAAITYIESTAGGGILRIPKGTYNVAGLVGGSNTYLKGCGAGVTALRLVANSATGTGVISYTSKNNFIIEDISFNGFKASQTNLANTVSIVSCTHYSVKRCGFFNAKGSGGSYGSGLVVSSGGQSSGTARRFVTENAFLSNDSDGLTVTDEWSVTVANNYFLSNTLNGMSMINYVFPPVANKQCYINISGNTFAHNLATGLSVVGYYTGGVALTPIHGPDTPASQFVTISNNIAKFNGNYGIANQANNVSIIGNVCSQNGGVSTIWAGILCNAQFCTVTGNTCYDNEYYGIDCGGLHDSVVSANIIANTGATSGATGININLGASVRVLCTGNYIYMLNEGAIGIYVCGQDGESSTIGFPWYGEDAFVTGNHIDMNGTTTGTTGIFVSKLFKRAKITNNYVFGAATANCAFLFECDDIDHSGNTDGYYTAALGAPTPVIASASTLVIPDHADDLIISGTTGITNIRPYSTNVFHQTVRGVRLTNRGTGYTSVPTVGFSGGGGSGAAGTAVLANDGSIAFITMTNHGSGYTSAPTVSITGGGGSSAAGTALVGCNSITKRNINLLFQDTLTVTDGGNLAMAGNFSATADDMLCFRGEYGTTWYEKSRSNN